MQHYMLPYNERTDKKKGQSTLIAHTRVFSGKRLVIIFKQLPHEIDCLDYFLARDMQDYML